MTVLPVTVLPVTDDELIARATGAREFAYVPYSRFRVGAALLGRDGRVFTGCNIENVSYGLTNCAERTAIFKAVSEGCLEFEALAVVADTEALTAPCGACRQVIAEYGPDTRVIIANLKGKRRVMTARELLPLTFTTQELYQGQGR